mgnify:CR=1 FL=1
MPTEESQNHKQSSTKSAASVPTITQLLRYVGTEMVAMPDEIGRASCRERV